MVARPSDFLRMDGYNHLPTFCEKKGRCRYCPKGMSRVKCCKCNMVLCLTRERNCFNQFHLMPEGKIPSVPEKGNAEDDSEGENDEDVDNDLEELLIEF